jgi:hypothetical protein
MIRKSDDDPPYLFDDIMRKAAEPPTDDDDDKLSAKLQSMVDAMIAAAPTLDRQTATHYLLHTPHGRRLAEHLNSISKHKETNMPQPAILKLATIMEDALMASVVKRDGESYAQSFSRRYENDIDFRRSWAAVSEAKKLSAMKGMAILTPTSVGVGNTNVSDDSSEAVRLLQQMCEKQGRSFESVFSDPANAKLASQTYTNNHRTVFAT